MDESEIDNLLPDEDLWLLLRWQPPCEYQNPPPYTEWACPTMAWVSWAKRVVLGRSVFDNVRLNDYYARRQALAVYICCLVRVHEFVSVERNGLQADDLTNMALSGVAVAGVDEAAQMHVVLDAFEMAKADGFLSGQEIDTWHRGMRSGTGMRTFYKLTLLGKRKADALGAPPAFDWSPRKVYEETHPPQKNAVPPWRAVATERRETTPQPPQSATVPTPVEPAPAATVPPAPEPVIPPWRRGVVSQPAQSVVVSTPSEPTPVSVANAPQLAQPSPAQVAPAPPLVGSASVPVVFGMQPAVTVVSKDGHGNVNVNIHLPAVSPTVVLAGTEKAVGDAGLSRENMAATTGVPADAGRGSSDDKDSGDEKEAGGADSGGWTAARVDVKIGEYIKNRTPLYKELWPRCVAGEKEALIQFRAVFGPSAIAAKLGGGLRKGTVGKAPTYIRLIKPVLNGKQPVGVELPDDDDGTCNDIIANMRRQAGGE